MKNIAIKNDNVGKKHLTLSQTLYYFVKTIKKFVNLNKKIYS